MKWKGQTADEAHKKVQSNMEKHEWDSKANILGVGRSKSAKSDKCSFSEDESQDEQEEEKKFTHSNLCLTSGCHLIAN
jgi:hypothetical protein